MRAAYVDPVSGASGDMLLGALLGAGVGLDALRGELDALALPGWSLDTERVQRAGFAATRALVRIEPGPPSRTLAEVTAIIERSALPAADRRSAIEVFTLLGEAEAEAHGRPDAASAHLHEVGAVDAIIDVVGTVVGLRLLGIERLHCGPLPLGSGTVRAAHGRLPVPAPAVLAIAARTGIPLAAPRDGEPAMELVTPTGAALLATLATFRRPALRLDAIGIGAGGRDVEGWPNVLRLWVGELGVGEPTAAGGLQTRPLVLVETDVDDMLPEHVPYLETRLREAGARDVWWSAVQMKKGRPGVQITVVADAALEQAMVLALLRDSSTLGVRTTAVTRYEAAREVLTFDCSLGPVAVKVKRLPGEPPRVAPEYEACAPLAERHRLPLAEVYRIVTNEALARLL